MLEERQQFILEAVVLSYIRDAEPVASQDLARGFRYRLSPATIRNEMLRLDSLGYLEQPHTSAGRVPTDKGYRFFVDYLLEDLELIKREQERIARLFSLKAEEEFVKKLSQAISELSEGFSAAGLLEDPLFYETGFQEILSEPEFQDSESVKTFGRFADHLEKTARLLIEEPSQKGRRIFIGAENPFREAKNFSIMLSTWEHPRGFKGFLAISGPKRMDYQKNLSLIDYIEKEYGTGA